MSDQDETQNLEQKEEMGRITVHAWIQFATARLRAGFGPVDAASTADAMLEQLHRRMSDDWLR